MLNWYLQSGKESDVVISTRIRFARNLAEFPFINRCKKEDLERIENKIRDIASSLGYGLKFLKLKDIDDITKMSLVEKHIISPKFALKEETSGAMLINDDIAKVSFIDNFEEKDVYIEDLYENDLYN